MESLRGLSTSRVGTLQSPRPVSGRRNRSDESRERNAHLRTCQARFFRTHSLQVCIVWVDHHRILYTAESRVTPASFL